MPVPLLDEVPVTTPPPVSPREPAIDGPGQRPGPESPDLVCLGTEEGLDVLHLKSILTAARCPSGNP